MDPAPHNRDDDHAAPPPGGAPSTSGPTPSAAVARKVPFNALPASTRERFIASLAGTGRPSPALSTTTLKTAAVVLWVLFMLGVTFALFVMFMSDYGSYRAPRQSMVLLPLYVGGLWLLGYASLAIGRHVIRDARLPYRRGRYVFPTDVVIATDDTLEMLPGVDGHSGRPARSPSVVVRASSPRKSTVTFRDATALHD